MSRPDLLDGSSTTTNFNGETSTYPSISTRMDPFSTALDRCAAGVLDAFAPSRGPAFDWSKSHPHVIGWRGMVPWPGWPRAYYLDGEVWRDTETSEPWPGDLAARFEAAWAAKFDLRGQE